MCVRVYVVCARVCVCLYTLMGPCHCAAQTHLAALGLIIQLPASLLLTTMFTTLPRPKISLLVSPRKHTHTHTLPRFKPVGVAPPLHFIAAWMASASTSPTRSSAPGTSSSTQRWWQGAPTCSRSMWTQVGGGEPRMPKNATALLGLAVPRCAKCGCCTGSFHGPPSRCMCLWVHSLVHMVAGVMGPQVGAFLEVHVAEWLSD